MKLCTLPNVKRMAMTVTLDRVCRGLGLKQSSLSWELARHANTTTFLPSVESFTWILDGTKASHRSNGVSTSTQQAISAAALAVDLKRLILLFFYIDCRSLRDGGEWSEVQTQRNIRWHRFFKNHQQKNEPLSLMEILKSKTRHRILFWRASTCHQHQHSIVFAVLLLPAGNGIIIGKWNEGKSYFKRSLCTVRNNSHFRSGELSNKLWEKFETNSSAKFNDGAQYT